ncbi:MAG: ABC transporter ATP-binding protein [Syntrophales bacterium]|jgi:ABC-2 type transport system ATP-binding protein|nr:ABC transporter ATP-binding protein [Syntrophales bacterium]
MSETVLRTIGLTKRYKNRLAVDHLNIEVQRGDVFGFLGPNGAGKSTTIRMILHLVFPAEGDVEIFGASLKKAGHKALAKVGAVVEKPAFYNHLSALRNMEILGGLQKPVSRRQIMKQLEQVGLADRADDPVKTYSHGMNQRLGLALILLNEPELVILDEPTTGLDPQGMKEVRELIQELARERGVTIFLSSHLLYEVELIATRMAIIHQGKLRVEGSVQDLLKKGPSYVLVKTDRPEEALQFLKTNAFGRSAAIQSDGINVELDLERIPELNRQLVNAGFNVNGLIPQRTLETYFLNLIEGREP